MKTETKYLRKLAESYFFGKEQLEEHEIALLKNSKFSNVLPVGEGSVFFRLAENALKEVEKNSLNTTETPKNSDQSTLYKEHRLLHHANSDDLEALTDSIKDNFDISVPPDYSHVSVDTLKEFIRKYTQDYIEDADTRHEIEKALKKNDPRSIMATLYTNMSI